MVIGFIGLYSKEEISFFACGMMVLTTAVLSILITAPLGAILMDVMVKKCLTRSRKPRDVSGRRNPGLTLPEEEHSFS